MAGHTLLLAARRAAAAALLPGLLAAALPVAAQNVALQGLLGSRALLIVDGAPPRSVAPGETHMGVKVLSTGSDQAVLEFGGRRHTLRVGDAPASVGGTGAGRGSTIVLHAGSGGHFTTLGTINGRTVQFVVDTGATSVAMSAALAERIGLNYRAGQRGMASTANGSTPMWRVRLDSVRIGDVEVHGVEAAVLASQMPFVLLGNSFLSRFQLRQDSQQLVLERRY